MSTAPERIAAGPYTLRPWEPADVAWLHDAAQDPDVAAAAELSQPFTARDALAFLQRSRQGRVDATELLFAIVRTDSDELLGGASIDTAGRRIDVWLAWPAHEQEAVDDARRALEAWASERPGPPAHR